MGQAKISIDDKAKEVIPDGTLIQNVGNLIGIARNWWKRGYLAHEQATKQIDVDNVSTAFDDGYNKAKVEHEQAQEADMVKLEIGN